MSNVTFVYVPISDDRCQSFMDFSRKHIENAQKYNDNYYIDLIFRQLALMVENVSVSEKLVLCQEEEEKITDYIKNRLQQDPDFSYTGLLVNTEPRNQSSIVGYYDLKFEHSSWRNNYFVLECKKLDASNKRLNEYVHKRTTSKEDGGIYRFIINKYAEDKQFGGMLGYVVGDSPDEVIVGLKEKIKECKIIYNGLTCGTLINPRLLSSPINGFRYSFQTNHTRANQSKIITPIHLFHLFLDLTN